MNQLDLLTCGFAAGGLPLETMTTTKLLSRIEYSLILLESLNIFPKTKKKIKII